MSQPLVVSIPHRLGKAEAVRRLQSGLGTVRSNFSHVLSIDSEIWTEDHLDFQVSAFAQRARGTIDVADDHVRLEVYLPWILGLLAGAIQGAIRREGTLMLEKR